MKGFHCGILLGLGANALWGLAFLAPVILADHSPMAISMGRYLAFGMVSVALGILAWRRLGRVVQHAKTALLFAVFGNIGYYVLLVAGIKMAGAPLATLVIGLLPVSVSLWGNFRKRAFPFRTILGPILMILSGFALLSAEAFLLKAAETFVWQNTLLGLCCALAALASWTWYAVANSEWLNAHPEVRRDDWATAVGIACMVCVLPLQLVLVALGVTIWTALGPAELLGFLVICLALGTVVSWGGTYLWNAATRLVPMSLLGQLVTIETVTGLAYVYAYEWQAPTILQFCAIALMLSGVIISIRRVG